MTMVKTILGGEHGCDRFTMVMVSCLDVPLEVRING